MPNFLFDSCCCLKANISQAYRLGLSMPYHNKIILSKIEEPPSILFSFNKPTKEKLRKSTANPIKSPNLRKIRKTLSIESFLRLFLGCFRRFLGFCGFRSIKARIALKSTLNALLCCFKYTEKIPYNLQKMNKPLDFRWSFLTICL